jgi:hypothetical protein
MKPKYSGCLTSRMMVSWPNTGTVYHFELNENRTALSLQAPLDDKIANTMGEIDDIIFAKGFGLITDLEIGSDGYLYILSSSDEGATIDRIVPK